MLVPSPKPSRCPGRRLPRFSVVAAAGADRRAERASDDVRSPEREDRVETELDMRDRDNREIAANKTTDLP